MTNQTNTQAYEDAALEKRREHLRPVHRVRDRPGLVSAAPVGERIGVPLPFQLE